MINYKDYKKAVKHRLYEWCLDNAIQYEKFKELIDILDDVDLKMQHNVKLVNRSFPSSSDISKAVEVFKKVRENLVYLYDDVADSLEFTGTQETIGLYYCPSCHAKTSIVVDEDKCPWCGGTMEKLA